MEPVRDAGMGRVDVPLGDVGGPEVGVDAGRADVPMVMDAGRDAPPMEEPRLIEDGTPNGCACRAGATTGRGGAGALFALAALLQSRRTRRTRSSSPRIRRE